MLLFKKVSLLFLLTLFSTFCINAQTNLITNGDFENWTGNEPDNWTTTAGTITRNQSDFSSGSSSVQIFNATTTQDATIQSDGYSLEGGKTYIYRVDVKMTLITGSSTNDIPSINARIDRANGTSIGNSDWHQTDSWETVQIIFDVPENDVYTFKMNIATSSIRNRVQDILVDNARLFDASESPENIDDRNALLALYNATGGPNWQNTWDLNQSLIYWDGITRNDSGRVTKIKLRANNLIGFIPPEIGNLTELQILDLTKNGFVGQQQNAISGVIPPEIGNLTKLKEIYLDYFEISGNLPSTMGQMEDLEILRLAGNNLTGSLPPEFGNLSKLKIVSLPQNELTGSIPNELEQLNQLEVLNLSNNDLSGPIPESMSQITNLSYLDLGMNNLTGGIPNTFGQFQNIKFLDLGQNNLGGTIPPELGQLTTIENLYIDRNGLTGTLPIELTQLGTLQRLKAEVNNLTGQIPAAFGSMTSLIELDLGFNQIEGTIPPSLGQLNNLTTLFLGRNNLTGNIPEELAQIPTLTRIAVDRNNLSGGVPVFPNQNSTFRLSSNSFIFEDLKNASVDQPYMSYASQSNVGISETISLESTQTFTVAVTATSDPDNRYQWRKDEINIEGATNATLSISNVSNSDIGSYDCLITNDVLTYLTLTKNPITLAVDGSSIIDADSDGVADADDQCPNTPEGESANSIGCSSSQRDTDNDGVTDNLDQCRNTPVNVEVNEFGCIITDPNQTNYLENFSFENWSGNPQTPDSWTIENANNIYKVSQPNTTDGNFSMGLDLSTSLSNRTELSTRNASQVTLQTNKAHTFAFDYKVFTGTGESITATLFILKDGGNFATQYITESLSLNTDGNWYTYSFDFNTDTVDEDYVFELQFRAPNASQKIVVFDNMRVLGETPPDADNDGVTDADDQCPNTSEDAAAVDDNGCEVIIDDSNLVEDPSFEDWSLNGGTNLRNWGRNFIPGSSWNKNEDNNDGLEYSVELTTANNGSNAASIFQNDIQIYKDVQYQIAISYKVIEGSFGTLELDFSQGIFQDSFKKFTVNPTATGWYTYTTYYTPASNEVVDLQIRVVSDQQQQHILLDNLIVKANVASTDDDNDGINNSIDQCPNTPAGEDVDSNGCAQSQLDDDNDGVSNTNDQCPNTPLGETVNTNGCSQSQLDDDNDGVNNSLDQCPDTTPGETVDTNGCSQSQLDDDNDGVTNVNDNCPDTPPNTAVDTEGCPINQENDADGDGVSDATDQCANTPAGAIVDANGCSESQLVSINNDDIIVKATSTSCQNTANGVLNVSFNEVYTYQVKVTGPSFDQTFNNINSTTGLAVENLPTGDYEVCITIAESETFERCFRVKIKNPEDFESGKVVIDKGEKIGKIVVSGSKNYTLFVNGKEINYNFDTTANQELSFKLKDGINNIVAKTDKECQGKYEESILLNVIRVFPNPVEDSATLVGLQNTENATISISDISGVLVKTVNQPINDATVQILMDDLPSGVYIVHIRSNDQDVQTKIVKK